MAAAAIPAMAQVQVANKIVGQVGNKIILQSDLNEMFNQEKQNNAALQESAKCGMLYNLLAQQVLVEQAGRDSVVVTDEEVDNILDNRIRAMMQQYGSKEAFEEANGGRTIYQLKEEFRTFFKDKSVADKMQGQIMDKVKVTPQEIDAFFKGLPPDSLPPYPATVEMGQIVIKPKVAPEIDALAKEKLEGIRKEIVENGKDFGTMAGLYSMDGTKDNGGEMDITRKEVDPQFASAAYRLQPGEISPVIKSKFGYHIIQMVRRMGEEAKVKHIIIIPEVTNVDLQQGIKKLDSVRAGLVSGKITFSEAVGRFSTDDQSKMTGGMIYNQNTGSNVLAIEGMDPQMAKVVGELKVGEYSQPQIFTDPYGSRATRILFLKSRTDPHILNMKDDYADIQHAALAKKQSTYINEWIMQRVNTYYIKIAPEYQDCTELKGWVKAAAASANK